MFKLLYIAFVLLFQNEPIQGEYESEKANILLKEGGKCVYTLIKKGKNKSYEYFWQKEESNNVVVKDQKGKLKFDFILLKRKDDIYLARRKNVERVKNYFHIFETSDSLEELLMARESLRLVLKRKTEVTSKR